MPERCDMTKKTTKICTLNSSGLKLINIVLNMNLSYSDCQCTLYSPLLKLFSFWGYVYLRVKERDEWIILKVRIKEWMNVRYIYCKV